MEKSYRCIKGFVVDICDGDGFRIEEDGMVIEVGEIWTTDDEGVNILGCDIHMENETSWLEVSKEELEKYFEVIE